MRVKNDRMTCAGNLPFAVNRGWNIRRFGFEQSRIQSAPLHHVANEFSVPAKVLFVGSDVGNREQARELIDDLSLMRAAIVSDRRLAQRWRNRNTKDRCSQRPRNFSI